MQFGSNLKVVTSLAILLLLGGCNTLANNSASRSDELTEQAAPVTITALDHFLSTAAPQSSALIADTPWGRQLEVIADTPYYAASGRTCRQLVLAVSQQKALACQQPNGSWIPSRFFN